MRIQVGTIRAIRVDHTNFFQGAIKTHSSLEVVERVLLVGDTPRIGAKRQIGS